MDGFGILSGVEPNTKKRQRALVEVNALMDDFQSDRIQVSDPSGGELVFGND